MANTGGEKITNTFQFKHHALLMPKITSINRIINATTQLTAAISGIEEAPPNKMEAIQSLCTLLLVKVTPLPSPAPSILPTPPVGTPTVNNKPVTIWNSQKVQTSPPAYKQDTPYIDPNSNAPAIIKDNSYDDTPTLVHS
jgi:hypothetical protein